MALAPLLLLLPGLDGTGRLFAPFVAAAGLECRVVAYPTDRAYDYPDLLDHIRARLPDRPFVLVAESFSGPLGIRLAAERPAHLRGLVLVCTFATAPVPVPLPASLAHRLVPWLPVRRVPVRLALYALSGEDPAPAARREFAEILAGIPDAVLHARLRAVLRVDARADLARVKVPVLYLQGAQDRLIGPRHAARIRRWHPATRVQRLRGPHFLLQARAAEAAAAIRAFVAGLDQGFEAPARPSGRTPSA